MDHSWRPHLPPPPIQGRICPSCSISHFPFCPPPTPFPSNPSFRYPPPHPNQPLPRPPLPPHEAAYDPFIDHRGGPPIPPPHRPTVDGYDHHPRPSDVYGNIKPSYDSPGAFNVGVKRMRADDSSGTFTNEKLTTLARFSTDNERRLQLISEFGGAAHELDKGRVSFDGEEYGKFDGFLGGKNSNSSYVDQGYGNMDRNQTFHDQERFERQQYPPREGNVQFGQLGYDKNLPQRNGYKYGSPQADTHHNVEHDQQNYEGSRYSSKLGDGYLPRHGVSGMNKLYSEQTSHFPVDGHSYNHHYSQAYAMPNHVESKSNHYGSPYDQRVNSADRSGTSLYSAQGCKTYASQPPLPASPPPPLPMEPPLRDRLVSSSPPGTSASLFPGSVGSSAPLSSYYPPLPEEKSISRYQPNLHLSSGTAIEVLLQFFLGFVYVLEWLTR
ncbi:hypothetical protein H5410_033713 [Solanum commersonii]|uniref:Uncharacterized protein n=1 Tax=Solanum commersonii TaxID=4109 RepID=A0A9J5YRE4_SOLCO|nr:hypothetical protein H5410_033713 [Solanum commersonii]